MTALDGQVPLVSPDRRRRAHFGDQGHHPLPWLGYCRRPIGWRWLRARLHRRGVRS